MNDSAAWRRRTARVALWVALALVCILAAVVVARETRLLDRLLIYFPDRRVDLTPGSVGLEYEDVFISTSDGVTLHGWFVPADSDLTLVWFHGNAGNVSHRVGNIALLHERVDVNIFIFDYRGYGHSESSPSERGLYLDAEAALEYLRLRTGASADKLVLFGRSLGGAVAVEMAARHDARAVIVESAFTSVRAMARRSSPVFSRIVPAGALVRARYDTLSRMKDVRAPILLIHGDADRTVPVDMASELYDAAPDPRSLYIIQGAAHNDTFTVGGNAYFGTLKRFLDNPAADPTTQ